MSRTGDPFLDAFHALQPDVDIVVLPPDGAPADLPYASASDAAVAARATDGAATTLLDESGLADPEVHPRTVFDRWIRLRDDVHTHRTRIRVEHPDGPAALDSLLKVRDNLDDGGWQPAPVDSPTPWIVASSPAGLNVEVVAEGRHLVITVTSVPLRVEEDPA